MHISINLKTHPFRDELIFILSFRQKPKWEGKLLIQGTYYYLVNLGQLRWMEDTVDHTFRVQLLIKLETKQ